MSSGSYEYNVNDYLTLESEDASISTLESEEAASKSKYIIKSGKNEGRFKKTKSSGGGGKASRFKGCLASGKSAALCAAIGRKAGRI